MTAACMRASQASLLADAQVPRRERAHITTSLLTVASADATDCCIRLAPLPCPFSTRRGGRTACLRPALLGAPLLTSPSDAARGCMKDTRYQ